MKVSKSDYLFALTAAYKKVAMIVDIVAIEEISSMSSIGPNIFPAFILKTRE